MRQLLLLRAPAGAGKSTWIEEQNLKQYTLSADDIRVMLGAVQYNNDGNFTIKQDYNSKVWKILFDMLEERMKIGATTIIDATHCKLSDIYKYNDLCRKYRYKLYVKEFSTSETLCKKRNKERPPYKQVPDEVIHNMFQSMVMQPLEYNNDKYSMLEEDQCFPVLKENMHDYINYKKIVAIGDIHGCIQPVHNYFINTPIKHDTLYVFMGDYFDRGKHNVEVFELLESFQQTRDNFVFLIGNHDEHLINYVYKSGEVHDQTRETIRQFVKANILKNRIKPFVDKLQPYFEFGGKFLFTHGGLVNGCIANYTDKEFVRGVGKYNNSHEVDESFTRRCEYFGMDFYSIHAHRNILQEPIHNTERTFNLCDEIEFGGYLRVLEITLADDSFKEVYVKNEQS